MLLKMDLRVNRQFAEINGLAAWTGFSLSVSFVTIDFRIVSSVVVCILDASSIRFLLPVNGWFVILYSEIVLFVEK